jgi:hypothetical protein
MSEKKRKKEEKKKRRDLDDQGYLLINKYSM